jgi:hypothetical protein
MLFYPILSPTGFGSFLTILRVTKYTEIYVHIYSPGLFDPEDKINMLGRNVGYY